MASYILHDDVSTVDLQIERNFVDTKKSFLNFYTTLGGTIGEYSYGNYLKWEIEVQYLTSSESLALNDWWKNGTDLTFLLDSGSSYAARIDNDKQPAKTPTFPYYDEFNAEIKLVNIT